MIAYVIDPQGNIVNSIVLDADAEWSPPDGCTTASGDYAVGGTLIDGVYTPPARPVETVIQPPSAAVLPQDLMAQFTVDDMGKIQTAIASDPAKMLLWYAMVAQRDPMQVTNARFLAGWNALVAVLGQPRMTAIATALGVTVA